MIRFVFALLTLSIATPALAERDQATEENWDAIHGHWRLDEVPGCGVDDVRAGRIVSVTDKELRYGALLCSVLSGAPIGSSEYRAQASCEIASDVESVILFDFDLSSTDTAILKVQGGEQPIWRCGEILE